MAARVLRVPRSDSSEKSSVLVHLTSSGASSLDLRLTATDGISPYITQIQEHRISELRTKQNKYSIEEWTAALRWGLLRQQTTTGKSFEHLELVASLPSEDRLCLSLRLVISGISQRLGNIYMNQDKKTTIQLFDWAEYAAAEVAAANSKLLELEKRNETLTTTIGALTAQLREFNLVKDEQEDTAFERFRQLLNRKKLKIRDQQRLLRTARIKEVSANDFMQARDLAPNKIIEVSKNEKSPSNKPIVREDEERGFSRKRDLHDIGLDDGEFDVERDGSHSEASENTEEELPQLQQRRTQGDFPIPNHNTPTPDDSEETDDEL